MTQPDAGEAAWKVVEEWLRDEGMPGWTLDTAGSDKVHLAQRIAAHVRALVEEKEARIRELERLGMEEVERGLKLEAALAEREREVERLRGALRKIQALWHKCNRTGYDLLEGQQILDAALAPEAER